MIILSNSSDISFIPQQFLLSQYFNAGNLILRKFAMKLYTKVGIDESMIAKLQKVEGVQCLQYCGIIRNLKLQEVNVYLEITHLSEKNTIHPLLSSFWRNPRFRLYPFFYDNSDFGEMRYR